MSEIPKKSKPISVRRYRIGDYAHYMGVGRDFLKHYEKCGLLSADHHDNGYRHFGFEQSSLILECMRLRNCGYTVREMGGMLRDLSGVEVRQSLHEAREALEKRIKHTQAIAAEIERLEEWFDIRQSQPEDWEVTSAEGRYYLPHANGSQFLEDERIYEILPQWLDWLSVVKSSLKFNAPDQAGNGFSYQWGLSVEVSKAERCGIPINGAVQFIPPEKVFVYHFGGLGRLRVLERLANGTHPLFEVLQSLNLRITGDCFMDIFMTANRKAGGEGYGVFRIPVEPKASPDAKSIGEMKCVI